MRAVRRAAQRRRDRVDHQVDAAAERRPGSQEGALGLAGLAGDRLDAEGAGHGRLERSDRRRAARDPGDLPAAAGERGGDVAPQSAGAEDEEAARNGSACGI